MAYFLGNPTLNPAVLVFLVMTLGWPWALLRILLGIPLVLGAALVATRLAPHVAVDMRRLAADVPAAPHTGHWFRDWVHCLVRLVARIVPEYVVIVALLGAARALFFPTGALHWGNNPLVLIGLAVLGTLFVIPTAGEIPIIQSMLAAGLGAGPAGVLLMTLAPVSLPSLVMVSRAFPLRVLAALAVLTAACGIAGGAAALLLHL